LSGEDDEAERHRGRAIALAPDDPIIIIMQARDLFCHGDIESALLLQRRAVALNPLNRIEHVNLASMLLVTGRPDEAESEFRTAHALDAGEPDQFRFDIAQIRILQGRYPEALVLADTLPRAEDRLSLRAMALHSLGQEREAADAIETLQRTTGPWAAVRLTEVSAFLRQHDRTKMAISILQAIVTEGAASKDELDDALAALEFSPFTWELWREEPWQSRWNVLLASLRELA
jgi:tetratricopeptide (TPR) repeat protein